MFILVVDVTAESVYKLYLHILRLNVVLVGHMYEVMSIASTTGIGFETYIDYTAAPHRVIKFKARKWSLAMSALNQFWPVIALLPASC